MFSRYQYVKELQKKSSKKTNFQRNNSVDLVCLFFEIFYEDFDLLFYLTDNYDLWCRSIEPGTEFIMSVR